MTVRWGVIGVGDVVEHKSGPALSGVPGSSIAAVMRRDGTRAQDFARRHDVGRWYDDAQALVEDETVDAVYVATPPDSHAEHVMRAAAVGKPVYVEKPMARDAVECAAMLAACERAGVPLYVAYYRRAMPRFDAVVYAVRAGRIGRPTSVTIRLLRTGAGDGWRLDPAISGGGLFVDLGSHQLDWLDHLLGPLGEPVAQVEGGPAETAVTASFVAPDGVDVEGRWDFASDRDLDELVIRGTDGVVRMSTFGTEPAVLTARGGAHALAVPAAPAVQWGLVTNVVAAIGGTAEPVSTGETAIRTSRLVDQVLAEHRARHGIALGG